jgi:transposase
MRPLRIRKPTASQLRAVHRLLQEPLRPWQRRRAETVLLFAAGHHATDIARLLEVHVNTTYADLHAFQCVGVPALRQERRVGARPRLTPAHRATIWRLAEQAPTALGLPWGRWTLSTLRTYLLHQRLIPTISREHLRRVLKKGGSGCGASGANWSAMTRSGPPSCGASAPSGGTARATASWLSSMSSPSR